mgnify:CR=1 FL=1
MKILFAWQFAKVQAELAFHTPANCGRASKLEAETTDSIAKITPEVMNRLQFAIEPHHGGGWFPPEKQFLF